MLQGHYISSIKMPCPILLFDLWNMRVHAACLHGNRKYTLPYSLTCTEHTCRTHTHILSIYKGATLSSRHSKHIYVIKYHIMFSSLSLIYGTGIYSEHVYTPQSLSPLCLLNNLKSHIISSFILPIWEKQLWQLANQIFQGARCLLVSALSRIRAIFLIKPPAHSVCCVLYARTSV